MEVTCYITVNVNTAGNRLKQKRPIRNSVLQSARWGFFTENGRPVNGISQKNAPIVVGYSQRQLVERKRAVTNVARPCLIKADRIKKRKQAVLQHPNIIKKQNAQCAELYILFNASTRLKYCINSATNA